MTRPNRFALGTATAALSLGFLVVVSGQGQGTVPPADLAKLIAVETKHIDAELAKASFLKKGQKRVRMAAFMIAAYAQNGDKGNAQAMATLRDQALKVMKAAEAGNKDETKKLAADLSTSKADPAAN